MIGNYDHGRKIQTELGLKQKVRRIISWFVPYADWEGDIVMHITGVIAEINKADRLHAVLTFSIVTNQA